MQYSTIVIILCGVLTGKAISQRFPSEAGGDMASEEFFIEGVDTGDSNAVMQWASNLCDGLDVTDTAATLDVSPTAEAVARRLMQTLPSSVQTDAVQVCMNHLATNVK